MDVTAYLAGAEYRLRDAVRELLGAPGAILGRWAVRPLAGGASAADPTRAVALLHGHARVGGEERPWQLVLKGFAPTPERADPAGIDHWAREWLLYRSGALAALPGGVAAPRGLGCDEEVADARWLWQEYVADAAPGRWTIAQWGATARRLGACNGAYLAGRPLPMEETLRGDRLRALLIRSRPLVARIAAAADDPAVRHWYPRPIVDAILGLWEERETFCAALDGFPRVFAHGDAIRRNLLLRRGPDGHDTTVLIDWEFAGCYAAGEEVGQTLSTAAAFYDLAPDELPALDVVLFDGYVAGLREAGWRGDPRQVRFAYLAHAALRNAFNAVGTVVPEPERLPAIRANFGHEWADLAARRAALRPILLGYADEARALLPAL